MIENLHKNRPVQLVIGLLIGIGFGFFLQKGGVTNYDVIIGQLLLTNFTVLKVIASAVLVGMPGVFLIRHFGYAKKHIVKGSVGSAVVGGLIFGIGFAVLGLCPGTAAGAAGQGSMDALFGGIVGLVAGSGLFAWLYPKLSEGILGYKPLKHETLYELLGVKEAYLIVFCLAAGAIFLYALEYFGI
ncbi:putative membrane protein YedE/YeeE [Methanomicrobium sp. W14]|uniref:YeeE/YedE thiosulfate transporter family protein n=1 Tax=Methanomicrobium sp. W14 TaxID=2817839 RepID=UPI001AE17E61|nr:YeeE/YedE thiosulfate transporter family protein [Methanomicrobium sp. W14]MBP2132529.1 putative membrane protein YedE/YeeE [Methanomicrobium sp. W14]